MSVILEKPKVKQRIKERRSEDTQAGGTLAFSVSLDLKNKVAAAAQEQNITAAEFIRPAVRKALADWRDRNN
jgi:hypothetical protein